jgi:hypothetical protein
VSNTLSGIATTATKDLSVVWNRIVAADAYLGEAATWLSNHLGLGKIANQLATGLKTLASAMLWAISELVNLILGEVKGFLGLIAEVIGSLAKGSANGISTALSELFSTLTASSPSSSSIMGSMGGLLLALFGLSGIANSLSSGLSQVMSLLQPILNLINPVRIAQVIGSAFGGNVGGSAVNGILGSAQRLGAAAMGLVANGLSSVIDNLVNGAAVPTLPNGLPPFPTGNQINNDASVVIGGSNSLASDFGSVLSQSYTSVTIAEIIHVGLIVGVLGFLILNQAVQVSVPNLSGFLSMYIPAFGGEPPSLANLPMRIAGEFVSLLISILSLVLSQFLNWVWELIIEVAGAVATWISGLEILLNPSTYAAGGSAAIPLLSLIGMGVSVIPPVVTTASNA